MRHNPRPQEIYRHFKGSLYQIRCLAKHTETGEMMVVYQAMYGSFEVYTRPLSMFMDEVDHAKYPSAGQKYRFELLEDAEAEVSAAPETSSKAEKEVAVPETFSKETEETAMPETSLKEVQQAEEELNIDPLVLEFLDANSYGQRLSILDSLHSRITDDMINMMAVSADLEIKDGDLEDRYMELRNCLRTFERYECNRLR
ncbi:MAG: DUF1653 domain-containing protein [Lachnospiraceae bacterium]|nr:DUF1653 domain-containing protein [Lachnospiraceae bacterium]